MQATKLASDLIFANDPVLIMTCVSELWDSIIDLFVSNIPVSES